MKTSIYGKMQMNISTNKILQSSLKLSPRKVIDSLLCHFRDCTKPFIHYINHYMIIQYFATAALKPSFAVKHLLIHNMMIFATCNNIQASLVKPLKNPNTTLQAAYNGYMAVVNCMFKYLLLLAVKRQMSLPPLSSVERADVSYNTSLTVHLHQMHWEVETL